MSHADRLNDENLEKLHDATLWVVTMPKAQRHWTASGSLGDQLIHRVGHSYTEIPGFGDDVHDRLTQLIKETMRKAGCDPKHTDACRVMVDRGEGEIMINLPLGTHESIVEKLTVYREQMLADRKK